MKYITGEYIEPEFTTVDVTEAVSISTTSSTQSISPSFTAKSTGPAVMDPSVTNDYT